MSSLKVFMCLHVVFTISKWLLVELVIVRISIPIKVTSLKRRKVLINACQSPKEIILNNFITYCNVY